MQVGVCMAVCSDYNSDLFEHIYIVALKVRMDRWFYSRSRLPDPYVNYLWEFVSLSLRWKINSNCTKCKVFKLAEYDTIILKYVM